MENIENIKNIENYIKENCLKYREIYYNIKDYIKFIFQNKIEDIYVIKHIINIYYNFIYNIPDINLLFNLGLPNELILDDLLEDLKKYLDDVFTINNFITFSYKLYIIKKTFDYEDQVFIFVNEFIRCVPYHNNDFYKNKEFNIFINNWTLNMKKILPINFKIKELNYMFEKQDFANLMYNMNYDEYRKGKISLSELMTFILYFKSSINIINQDMNSIKDILDFL
jgi:hypothetical protein